MLKPNIKKERPLSNFEVIRLYIDLTELSGITGLILNYQINATRRSLKPLYEAYQQDELIPKSAEYKDYEKELNALYTKLATPEGAKLPRTRNNGNDGEILDLDINADNVVNERIKLQGKYVNTILERQKQNLEYKEWLQEPCKDEYKLFKIKSSYLPDNKQIWDACTLLIDDDMEEKKEDKEEVKPETKKKLVKK